MKKKRLIVLSIIVTSFLFGCVKVDGHLAYYSRLPQREAFEGQVLFTPLNSTVTYLMNSAFHIVRSWHSNYGCGFGTYLENGSLFRASRPYDISNFLIGGRTGQVEKFDWNGSLIWNFVLCDSENCLHHDIKPLPNGNVLMQVWENKSYRECVKAGRNPVNLSFMIVDYIIEVNQNKEVVWAWHVWDHLIQDFDPSKAHYGNVSKHPELIDINLIPTLPANGDWTHFNTLDYNKYTDEILTSSRNLNEIFIINHSTGKIVYRFGHPHNYRANGIQKLFGQHDCQWIKPGYVGEGNLIVFNNGNNGRNYTTVDEINMTQNKIVWSYNTSTFVTAMGGAERLYNGDTLYCDSIIGKIYEVSHDRQRIWNYTVGNMIFKMQYYNIYNQQPSSPRIQGPSDCQIGQNYSFTFNSTDRNKIRFYIDWGDDQVITKYQKDSAVCNHSWSKNGNYTIKVFAEDIYGAKSGTAVFLIRTSRDKMVVRDVGGFSTGKIHLLSGLEPEFSNKNQNCGSDTIFS